MNQPDNSRPPEHETAQDDRTVDTASVDTASDDTKIDQPLEQPEPAEHSVGGIILDTCLGVVALTSCIVAFATSGRMEDRSATQPVPLHFADREVAADLTVRIDDRNRLIVQKQPLDEFTTLHDYLTENKLSPASVHIVASQDSLVESVMHAIRSLKRHGVSQVFLSTSSI